MTGASGAPVTYALHQSIRYDYPGPIHHLAHRLMIVPPLVHGDQRRLAHRIDVRQSSARVVERVDGFGNHVIDVRAELVEVAIEFDAWIDVERAAAPVGAQAAASQLGDRRLLEASPLTTGDDRLDDAARTLARGQ